MIEYTSGDILKCEADALVNTVNCVGVMGRGIALQFKNVYPDNFKAYEAACKREAVQPGRMFVFDTGQLTLPRFIINFPTKRHWRGKSRIEDIESGLTDLVKVIRDKGIRSIAIPPLGAGLGGLDWSDVRPRIERALTGLADVQAARLSAMCEGSRCISASSREAAAISDRLRVSRLRSDCRRHASKYSSSRRRSAMVMTATLIAHPQPWHETEPALHEWPDGRPHQRLNPPH